VDLFFPEEEEIDQVLLRHLVHEGELVDELWADLRGVDLAVGVEDAVLLQCPVDLGRAAFGVGAARHVEGVRAQDDGIWGGDLVTVEHVLSLWGELDVADAVGGEVGDCVTYQSAEREGEGAFAVAVHCDGFVLGLRESLCPRGMCWI
jgi:hypothetical protein